MGASFFIEIYQQIKQELERNFSQNTFIKWNFIALKIFKIYDSNREFPAVPLLSIS